MFTFQSVVDYVAIPNPDLAIDCNLIFGIFWVVHVESCLNVVKPAHYKPIAIYLGCIVVLPNFCQQCQARIVSHETPI